MKTRVLITIMLIIAWIVFIGLMVKAGSVIVSWLVSLTNSVAAKDLYMGMDLSAYREKGLGNYSFLVFYIAALYGSQSYISYLVIKLLRKINLVKPFSAEMVKLLHRISVAIVLVWGIVVVSNIHTWVLEKNWGINGHYMSRDFLFFAGVVFVLAKLFERGVVIQSENELTV